MQTGKVRFCALATMTLGLGLTGCFGESILSAGAKVVVAGHGGYEHALSATVVGKREFAGYWEYVLDEAIFTTPAHPNWGGAALIGPGGDSGMQTEAGQFGHTFGARWQIGSGRDGLQGEYLATFLRSYCDPVGDRVIVDILVWIFF